MLISFPDLSTALSGAWISFSDGLLVVVLGQAACYREQMEEGGFLLEAAKKEKESLQMLLIAKKEVTGASVGDLVCCLWLFTQPWISGLRSLFVVGVVEEDI
jgi:hypothetical protein